MRKLQTLSYVVMCALLWTACGGMMAKKNLFGQEAESDLILSGDMILQKSRISHPEVSTQGATSFSYYASQPWRNGVVAFEFDGLAPSEIDLVMDACAQWAKEAKITCKRREGGEKPYAKVFRRDPFKLGSACYAEVGAPVPGGNEYSGMYLPEEGCFSHHNVRHEMGHLLGFMHEHQRADRDEFVDINLDNADSNFHYAFDKIQSSTVRSGYDFLSLMHYHPYTFSKNGTMTISPKAAYADFTNQMGNGQNLSDGDTQSAVDLYGSRTGPEITRTLSILVVDSLTKLPVKNSFAKLSSDVLVRNLVTDGAGRMVSGQIPQGIYKLEVLNEFFELYTRNILLDSNKELTVELIRKPVVQPPTVNFSLLIQNKNNGDGIQGAQVIVSGRMYVSDNRGYVMLGQVAPEAQSISITAKGFKDLQTIVVPNPNNPVLLHMTPVSLFKKIFGWLPGV